MSEAAAVDPDVLALTTWFATPDDNALDEADFVEALVDVTTAEEAAAVVETTDAEEDTLASAPVTETGVLALLDASVAEDASTSWPVPHGIAEPSGCVEFVGSEVDPSAAAIVQRPVQLTLVDAAEPNS